MARLFRALSQKCSKTKLETAQFRLTQGLMQGLKSSLQKGGNRDIAARKRRCSNASLVDQGDSCCIRKAYLHCKLFPIGYRSYRIGDQSADIALNKQTQKPFEMLSSLGNPWTDVQVETVPLEPPNGGQENAIPFNSKLSLRIQTARRSLRLPIETYFGTTIELIL